MRVSAIFASSLVFLSLPLAYVLLNFGFFPINLYHVKLILRLARRPYKGREKSLLPNNHVFFMYLSVDGHSYYFYILVIINTAAMNIAINISF